MTPEEKIARLLWERFAPSHAVEWDSESHKAEYLSVAADILARHPEAAENPVGAAEREVGRYVYRRIEVLMDAKPDTPEGAELDYLSRIVSDVEEYGADEREVLADLKAEWNDPEHRALRLAKLEADQ